LSGEYAPRYKHVDPRRRACSKVPEQARARGPVVLCGGGFVASLSRDVGASEQGMLDATRILHALLGRNGTTLAVGCSKSGACQYAS
jgi:hypothetical protein